MQQRFLLQILLLAQHVHHYAHHQELKSIVQWLLPVVIPSNLQITFYIFTAPNTTGSNHCIILLSS